MSESEDDTSFYDELCAVMWRHGMVSWVAVFQWVDGEDKPVQTFWDCAGGVPHAQGLLLHAADEVVEEEIDIEEDD